MLRTVLMGAALALAGAAAPAQTPVPQSRAQPQPCPEGVADGAKCMAGRDAAGAYYWLAVPERWNGILVLHAHGGPELGEPTSRRTAQDLSRWAVFTRAGYAWAGSSFRQGGVAVRSAAEDTERVRRIFTAEVGAPKLTLLHGQSWGASVAARAAEMFTAGADGKPPYDVVLLTSGVLGGGTKSYDFRLDLRVVYQAVCANHPKPDEPDYPLWQGLPLDAGLTRAELAGRVDDCTGVRRRPEDRTEAQRRHLKTLLDVIHIPERSLIGHLNWGTWHFQDIVFKRLGGRNPFGNTGVRYRGSPDDAALNGRVLHYTADPQALAAFGADTDPQGRIPVPVLTVHAIDDPVAFVELESVFRATMARAGRADHLVQVFTSDHEHSYLSDPQYLAATEALLAWVQRGEKPTPQAIAARCQALAGSAATGCRFRPDFEPAALAERVPAR